MKKIKIGFIISKYKSLHTKFNSGSEQNTYHLVSLFRSIPEYDVSYVLTENNSLQESLYNQQLLGDDTPLVELQYLDPKLSSPIIYDILIHIESYLSASFIEAAKRRFSTKFVNFVAGIVMWGLMEDIVYNGKNQYTNAVPNYPSGLIDEYWMSPHHSYQKTYLETITKSHIAITPYIYEPYFLIKAEEERKKVDPNFNPRYALKQNKHIGVLEPNINLVKNAVIPICIVESLYCQDPDALREKKVRVYGSSHLHQRQAFQHLFNYFDSKFLFTSEKRYGIVDILHYDCDLIISHQHLCALNYLYLDALYYGIPLVHNSPILEFYGYYYPSFDTKKGSKALKQALETHDLNINKYIEDSKKALYRFSIKNDHNIKKYKEIISSLLSR